MSAISHYSDSLKSSFSQALENKDIKVCRAKTRVLFDFVETGQRRFHPERTLSLIHACRLGDIRIIKWYLDYRATASDEGVLEALEFAKNKRDNPESRSRKLEALIALVKKMESIRQTFPLPPSSFLESLHTACFLSQNTAHFLSEKGSILYHGKRVSQLPSSLLLSGESAYVLFSRKSRPLGTGSYKKVYPALRVSLRTQKVWPVVQIVSVPDAKVDGRFKLRDRFFEKKTLHRMSLFSKLGDPFPRLLLQAVYHSSNKDLLCEIAIQKFWAGGSLRKYTARALSAKGKALLDLNTQISVATDLASGMLKMHNNKFVHGDLKPDNCLFDGVNRGGITDFDLLYKVSKSPPVWEGLFHYGSLPYVPPEQLEAFYMKKGAGQAGDMYALGLILHEIALGTPVWFDALVSYFNSFLGGIEKIYMEYQKAILRPAANKEMSYAIFLTTLRLLLESSKSRKWVIEQQLSAVEMLHQLEAIEPKTLLQQYHLLIFRLLHPDPSKRLTANQFYAEVSLLNK